MGGGGGGGVRRGQGCGEQGGGVRTTVMLTASSNCFIQMLTNAEPSSSRMRGSLNWTSPRQQAISAHHSHTQRRQMYNLVNLLVGI